MPYFIPRHCQHEKFVTTFWMFGKNVGKFQYSVWIDIVDIGLLTINSYRASSANFLDIIVFAFVCIVVVVSICERLCVVLLVTWFWTMMYWYMHWCVELENENAFQMYKRFFYCTHTHAHTHTHTTNVTVVRSVRRCASTSADDRCRRCTSAIHVSLHRQQIREWVAFWTL